eukprot:6173702-Pleurochrysis_carterae.AAC.5
MKAQRKVQGKQMQRTGLEVIQIGDSPIQSAVTVCGANATSGIKASIGPQTPSPIGALNAHSPAVRRLRPSKSRSVECVSRQIPSAVRVRRRTHRVHAEAERARRRRPLSELRAPKSADPTRRFAPNRGSGAPHELRLEAPCEANARVRLKRCAGARERDLSCTQGACT